MIVSNDPTAFCCGLPMIKTRDGNRIHYRCGNPNHGRAFSVLDDSVAGATCSCFSGFGELDGVDLGPVRLYRCINCGATSGCS